MKKRLFIVVNQDSFFLSHRLPVGLAAAGAGYDVTVVCEDTGVSGQIIDSGLNYIALPINKAGKNIGEELVTLSFLYRLFRSEKPDLVHLVGLKIMLWGGIAAKLAGVKGVVSSVSGLGLLFDEKHSGSFLSKTLLKLLKITHRRKNVKVVFQNMEDKAIFLSAGVVDENQCAFTRGSGVDLHQYGYSPEPDTAPVRIIFTARMVEDKGTMVLIEAAGLLENEYRGQIQFLLCGGLDTNPNGITEKVLNEKCDGEYIKWLGRRDDIPQLLEQSHIMAFPSWYREGLPKSVIEAEAKGRPVVTTDSVGCRDTVENGSNGFIVPVKDAAALAEALKFLIDHPEIRRSMGKKAREFAVANFNVEDVVKVHLNLYNSLLE